MPIVISIFMLTLGWSEVRATSRVRECKARLTDLQPEFEPDLRLDAKQLSVTYKGRQFRLTPSKFLLLQLVLGAPNEVLSYEDLFKISWRSNAITTSHETFDVYYPQLRDAFLEVDPYFNKLRTKWGQGFYWARDEHAKTVVGRVGVANFIFEGYADGHAIALMPKEHSILSSVLNHSFVSAASEGTMNTSSFKTIVCGLNRRFRQVLGTNVLVRAPSRPGVYQLNGNVLAP